MLIIKAVEYLRNLCNDTPEHSSRSISADLLSLPATPPRTALSPPLPAPGLPWLSMAFNLAQASPATFMCKHAPKQHKTARSEALGCQGGRFPHPLAPPRWPPPPPRVHDLSLAWKEKEAVYFLKESCVCVVLPSKRLVPSWAEHSFLLSLYLSLSLSLYIYIYTSLSISHSLSLFLSSQLAS